MTTRRRPSQVFFGVTSLLPGDGGIARVARLVARVLAEHQRRGELSAEVLALTGAAPVPGPHLAISTASGSRLRYVAKVNAAALRYGHFLYDFLGMARAHSRFPILRRPFAAWVHGIEVWEEARADRLRTAARAVSLFCNSNHTRERATRLHGSFARAQVCWLATESDEPGPVSRRDRGPPTALILGRIEEGRDKGHEALIRCWPKVVSSVPEARLVVVGKGAAFDAVRALAAVSRAASHIDFRGFVPDEAMPAIWEQTSVLAMPSRGEGFGLVYIEAMQRAVPVVASIHDAAPEINRDGETGYNVDLDHPDELPERLIALLKDPDLAERLGGNGQHRWRTHFCYSAFERRFTPLLRDFLWL